MEQVGIVKKVEGNEVVLEVRRVSACGTNCSSCSGSCEVAPHFLTLENKVNAKLGDMVEIKAEAKKILKYTFALYIIPLVFLILGIALGNGFFKGRGYENYELLSFLTGIIGLVISYVVLKILDNNMAKKAEEVLTISRIL
ncbi:MAG: SoxR reducing system RseC family protein [Tissierellaceae bacterium]|jgi:sigma-E factor negative regulatory protein RseC|nr:SoxR reducing system RseC family protein [Tissierellia bacterium]